MVMPNRPELDYEFKLWSTDMLAGALRAMAFADPNNIRQLHLLEECAQRLLIADAAMRLSGDGDTTQDRHYRELLKSKGKTQAIKAYREDNYGMGLLAAKEYIESL